MEEYYAKRFWRHGKGIVTDGLKLWLDRTNPLSYPNAGTTWFDLSGNNNNGTMVNGVTPVSNAMSFDGVNDYVNMQSLNSLPVQMNTLIHTFSFWVKANSTNMLPSCLIGAINTGTATAFSLSYNINASEITSVGTLNCVIRGNTGVLTICGVNINTGINDGNWHNLLVEVDAKTSTIIFYLDNILLTTTCSAKNNISNMAAFTSNLSVGARNNRGTYQLFSKCLNNDNLIYNRALTSDERTQNFNATKTKYGL